MVNPYESSASSSMPAARIGWYQTHLTPVAKLAFWLGTILFTFGHFISFFPGTEAQWFAGTAVVVGLGFFVPSKNYRIATLLLVAACIIWTYVGYRHGIEYQEWLKTSTR